MSEVQTVIALPFTSGVRVRTHKSAKNLRSPARSYPSPVVPMFTGRPQLRERSQAGWGIALAFGFSAICWAGLASLIF